MLTCLPSELLLKIFSYLPYNPDILELSRTSALLRQIQQSDSCWRMLSKRDYNAINTMRSPGNVYQKFHRKYGQMVGVYRLYTFFSKHMLQVLIDPGNCRQLLFRTWNLDEQCNGGYHQSKRRDVLKICYHPSRHGHQDSVVCCCLEGGRDVAEDGTFCFNDHSAGASPHYFSFHLCENNLFFNPLKGEKDFEMVICPKGECKAKEFTKVVCCQKVMEVERGSPWSLLKPGIFRRYADNLSQNRNLMDREKFITLSITTTTLTLSHFTSQHAICSASLLWSLDLNDPARGSFLTTEPPKYVDIDRSLGQPFTFCETPLQHIDGQSPKQWPRLYKAALMDVENSVIIVLFSSTTIGLFFNDRTVDLLERFDFQ